MRHLLAALALLALSACVDSTGFGVFDAYVGPEECRANGWTWKQPPAYAFHGFAGCRR